LNDSATGFARSRILYIVANPEAPVMAITTAGHPSVSALAAFALGRLDAHAAETVHDHLAGCPDCRTVVETTPNDSLLALLRNAAGNTPAPVASPLTGTQPLSNPSFDEAALPPELRDHPRYRIVRKLGEGGMGAVYQAEHKIMERVVAVKVISPSFVDSPEAVERFQREVRAAAKLEHPNIVRAYDADRAGSTMLLAMEFVKGRSLAEVVAAKGPLPVAYAAQCVRQAAQGLQHAADHGMVHRDIKPQNLMLTDKGVVKILDFGLAKLVSERTSRAGLTGTGMVMGTPEYMAPEQARDTAAADIRADIYALGCTLFFLLTGRPPFRGGAAIEILTRQVTDAPPRVTDLRPEVPAHLADLISRMLAKDPAERPQTPREVATALAPLTKPAARTVSRVASVLSPPAPERPVGRRGRWLPLAAVAATLLTGGLLAGIVLTLKTKDGVVTLQVDPPDAKVEAVDGKITVSRPGDADPWRIELAGEKGQLKISKAGFEVTTRDVTLSEKGTTIRVELRPEAPVATVTPTDNVAPTPLPDTASAKPELIAVWKHEVFERNKWMPRSDVLQYSNGKLNGPNSIHTWNMTGNSLTFIWSRGSPVDQLNLSSDGREYAGTNQVATPIRGFLRWKKSQESVDAAPGRLKAVLTAIWWVQVNEGGNWVQRPDALLLSNGTMADSNTTWEANGKDLTFANPSGVFLRVTLSDDNRRSEGTNRSGQKVRAGLRWTRE
jgi:predicted Ser/Thr protein kinase